MRVCGLAVPTWQQFINRPDTDPRLIRYSNLALAAIGAISLYALRSISARVLFPVVLVASVGAWLLPYFYQPNQVKEVTEDPKPDPEAWKSYGLSDEIIDTFVSQAETGKFDEFEQFLTTFCDQLVVDLKFSPVLHSILSVIEKGIEQQTISYQAIKIAQPVLRRQGVFSSDYFKHNLEITTKEEGKFSCNKAVLIMSSPDYFYPLFTAGFSETGETALKFPSLSNQVIGGLLHFLSPDKPKDLTIAEIISLIEFSDLAMINGLSIWSEQQAVKLAAHCTTIDKLEDFLSSFRTEVSSPLNPKFIGPISFAFTAFFRTKYPSFDFFRYTEGLFTIPVEALNLLNDGDAESTAFYLNEYVNCITLTRTLNIADFARLKVVNGLRTNAQKAKLTTLQIQHVIPPLQMGTFFKKFLETFPEIKAVSLTLWPGVQYDGGPFVQFFEYFKGKHPLLERVLSFGDFYGSSTRFENPKVSNNYGSSDKSIFEILKLVTRIVNLKEGAQIALPPGVWKDTFASQLLTSIKEKVDKEVASIEIYTPEEHIHYALVKLA